MAYTTMSHVGLEDDFATPEQLKEMSTSWHYGWTWSGPQPTDCCCSSRPCGLVVPVPQCQLKHHLRLGSARQLHKASACPA